MKWGEIFSPEIKIAVISPILATVNFVTNVYSYSLLSIIQSYCPAFPLEKEIRAAKFNEFIEN